MDKENPSSENKPTSAASAKPRQKMRLAPRPTPMDVSPKAEETTQAPPPTPEYKAPRLKGREKNASQPSDEPLEELSTILEAASKGDRARERRLRWALRIRRTLAFLITLTALTLAFFATARWALHWPILSFSHWLAFLIVFAVAALVILRSLWIIQVRREGWLGLFGCGVAATLIAWNIVVYEAMAHHPERNPGAPLWLPANALQAGLAVEIQRSAAGSANAYRSASGRDVVLALRKLPRSEWREIYEQVLEPTEISRVTYVNVDSWLPTVGDRVVAYRLETLASFLTPQTGEDSEARRIRNRLLAGAFWPYARGIEYFGMP